MLFGATICCMHKKLLPQSTGFWEENVLNLFSPCTWIYAPLLLFAALPVARELQLNINKQLWNLATNQNKVKTSKLLYLQYISDLLFEFHLSFPNTLLYTFSGYQEMVARILVVRKTSRVSTVPLIEDCWTFSFESRQVELVSKEDRRGRGLCEGLRVVLVFSCKIIILYWSF